MLQAIRLWKKCRNNFYSIDIHPIFLANISLILGIYSKACDLSLGLLFLLSFLLLSAFAYGKQSTIFSLPLCTILSFILGFSLYGHQITKQKNFEQSIANTNRFHAQVEAIEEISSSQRFHFKNVVWLEQEKARIQIYTYRRPLCEVGDYIEITDLSIKPSTNEKFHHYLIKENIQACCFINALKFQLKHQPRFSFKKKCWLLKSSMKNRLKKKLTPQAFALWAVLFLGDKNIQKNLIKNIKDHCKNWGISHMLARSGLHLMLFIFLWAMMLMAVPCPIFFKQYILIILVLIYTCLSTISISYVRGVLTFLVSKFCILQNLDIRPFHVINLVCFLTLAYNPAQLFYLDFQLSFSLTAALVFFSELELKKKLLIRS